MPPIDPSRRVLDGPAELPWVGGNGWLLLGGLVVAHGPVM